MALFTKTIRKHIFLHPMDKNRGSAAVKSTLLQDKNKYSDQLEGSLLDVSSVKVIRDRYLIVNGYLSMEVVADCVVFSPKVGQTLEGVINKKSKSHLGCLVMDTFNAALDIPASFGFQPHVGNSCKFVVTKVVVDGNIPFLRGTLASLTSYENTTNSFKEIEDMSMEEDVTAKKLSRVKTEDGHWTTENDSHIEKYNSDNERAVDVLPEQHKLHGSGKKKSKKSPNKVKNLTSYENTTNSFKEIEDMSMEEDVTAIKLTHLKTEDGHWATENDSHIEKYNSDNERAMDVLPEQHKLHGSGKKKSKKSPNKVKK